MRWNTKIGGGVVVGVLAGLTLAAGAVDMRVNVLSRAPYPEHDYSFQDKRSIHNILSARLDPLYSYAGDPDDPGASALCFDPDNPPSPEVMAQVNQYMQGIYAGRYNIAARWSIGVTGDPIELTWSFVPDGTIVGDSGAPGGSGASNLFSRMDSIFGGLGRATWINQFQRSFDRWQALCGVSYTRVRFNGAEWDDGASWGSVGAPSLRGDIRIGMKNIDGAGGILAYNAFPNNGDMVLDAQENWNTGSSSDWLFLRNVIMHEHGHGLGFAHVCPQGTGGAAKLMAPFASTAFNGPQQDDIRAAHRNYGDPFEDDNVASRATLIGTINAGQNYTVGQVPSPTPASASILSIDATNERDYFRFNIDQPQLVNITVTPIGSTYNDNEQNANCTSTGATTNALTMANLAFDVRNGLDTVVFRTVNDTVAGQAESTTGLLVSPTTSFLVRVFASGSVAEPQGYRLQVSAQNVNLQPTATQGTFPNFVRVTWPSIISDATGYQIIRNTTDSVSLGFVQIGQVDGSTHTFDDETAVPGQEYYYFIRAQQPGNTNFRYMSMSGAMGFRQVTNQPPVANAGEDQVVVDEERAGEAQVTLDGSASTDPDGTIVNYRWTIDGDVIAESANAVSVVTLAVGDYTVTLTVRDNENATGTDTVNISVVSPCPADFNGDGGVDGGDVEAFFLAWEAGDPAADVNGDGGIDGGDVETFFVAWEAGGCD
ncbi:MAG: matrixin family metalloprotease [Phycisphaeraceae bacterium]|nr:matrixin family metalloprotease [Phycisphaeraceae bacterium]